ncbi:MAG: diphthine--ammonia ligase [Candidatus Bathyarchaeota archaeon]|nr:diphthine--ammonia ligase [Candidatus Termiticorpusculum sp.]MCL1971252.1 diphthine--ammonia ligase [Candidatus Termiticorpusculum sp.]
MKLAASWSGGKDSAFAFYLAKQQGHEVVNILTMMMSEEKSFFHLMHSALLAAQADAMGVSLIKKYVSNETYEHDFKEVLVELKAKGVEGLVTGDIYDVAGHEEGWLSRVCREIGLKPVRPLWMGDTKQIFLNYINAGFKATVVRTKLGKLGEDWLGRVLDRSFYDDILKLGNVDPCGEDGEYHTVVTDGPCFKKAIDIVETRKHRFDNNFGYLEIKDFVVKHK